MSKKDKSGASKDIDDVLSSIDSLLDTATDIEADDLPVLDIDSGTESDADKKATKQQKLVGQRKTAVSKKKTTRKKTNKHSTPAKKSKVHSKEPTLKKSTRVTATKPQSEQKKPKTKSTASVDKPKPVTDAEKTTKVTATEKKIRASKSADRQENKTQGNDAQPESTHSFFTTQSDLSLAQRELPVLDEIISEEEMALIAAGKQLPKRVITEKFIPKTVTDKIIDILAIQLSDYNISRLEFEYLHELIDELLTEEKNKKK